MKPNDQRILHHKRLLDVLQFSKDYLIKLNCLFICISLKSEMYLAQITSGKWVGNQNQKHPNMIFQNHKITGKDSICSKQAERKIR